MVHSNRIRQMELLQNIKEGRETCPEKTCQQVIRLKVASSGDIRRLSYSGPPDLPTLFIARLIFLSENSYSLTRQRGEFFLVRSLGTKTKWFSKNIDGLKITNLVSKVFRK